MTEEEKRDVLVMVENEEVVVVLFDQREEYTEDDVAPVRLYISSRLPAPQYSAELPIKHQRLTAPSTPQKHTYPDTRNYSHLARRPARCRLE